MPHSCAALRTALLDVTRYANFVVSGRVGRRVSKFRFALLVSFFSLASATTGFAACSGNDYLSGNVTVSNATILRDGVPWIAKGATVVGIITTPRNYPYTNAAGPIAAGSFNSETIARIKTLLHGDTVRIQIHQSILDPQSRYYDPTYVSNVIAPAVATARRMGLVVILSMNHGWGLDSADFVDYPTAITLRAWQQVAPRFGCDRGVMYELYNEPTWVGQFPEYWQAWRDQHQPIIDLIRSYGALNALIVDGPHQVLAGVLGSHIHDPMDNLIFAVHPYPTINGRNADPSQWYKNFGYLAGKAPVFIGEWALTSRTACRADLDTFVVRFLQQIHEWKIPLLGWALDTAKSLTSDPPAGTHLTSYRNFQCAPHGDNGPGLTLQHYFATGEVRLL